MAGTRHPNIGLVGFSTARAASDQPIAVRRVAVGTRVSSRAPRTEPYGRLSRIRLPPRVCDGKAIARPRMEDNRFRKPGVHQLRHPFPRHPILLAATPQRAPPEIGHMMPFRAMNVIESM